MKDMLVYLMILKAEEAGMNGHIAKPLDIPSMRTTLKNVLKDAQRSSAV